jgi:lipopolysaccharide biosynthesis glycosyltransferase
MARAGESLRVVTSCDSGFLRPLAVMLASLRRHHGDGDLEITLLTESLTPDEVSYVASGIPVQVVTLPTSLCDAAYFPAHLAKAALFRLGMQRFVTADVSRVLYIDADVIVRRPLDELWRTDLGDALLAAVIDPVVPWAAAPDGLPWRALGLPPDAAYFNSGVMVVNLDRWRHEQIGERAIELLRTHKLPHADQGGLNAVLRGNWKRLPPWWNLQTGYLPEGRSLAPILESAETLDEAVRNPAIVHFQNSPYGRPWVAGGCSHPFRDEWYAQLDETPFRGWRPQPHPPRLPMLTRLRRAAGIIVRGRG